MDKINTPILLCHLIYHFAKDISIRIAVFILFLASGHEAIAQGNIRGAVFDSATRKPLSGAVVIIPNTNFGATTGESGIYELTKVPHGNYTISVSHIGYSSKLINISVNSNPITADFRLKPASVELKEVVVSSQIAHNQQIISNLDINIRPINNSQEILRMVPGLFIAQHAGGGKAEQIFLRGMDLDHGTDIRITVDGIPVNMVSHAHGQGYADLHFVIPELVQNVNFNKGPYRTEDGNLTTAGSVAFNTKNTLGKSFIKTDVGQYQTYRTVAGIDLLGQKGRTKNQDAYVAGEYSYSRSFFDNSQHFKRLNLMSKYNGQVSKNSVLTATASTLWSTWDFSGEIPERAVSERLIGFYGALDTTQRGATARTNASVQLLTRTPSNDLIKNQIFYTNNTFELYSNFTYFLTDSIQGDQIRQKEARNMFGYNGSYTHDHSIGNISATATAGIYYRHDLTNGTELAHTKDGSITLQRLEYGNINEQNLGIYAEELVQFSNRFTMNAGVRIDYFSNQYRDRMVTPPSTGTVKSNIICPKLNFYYTPNSNIQFYLKGGKGFHSNDTRVVVRERGIQTLPAAWGSDLGAIFKPVPNLLVNMAAWYLWLNQEFVYVGDVGVVEPTDKTRRYGIDLSVRYQLSKNLFFDGDLNTAKPRYVSYPEGQNYVPLGPLLTTTGGLTFTQRKGFGGSLRYRYMGNRPANEDNTVVAVGYLVCDGLINYTNEKYVVAFSVQNIFNRRWEEAQFDTTTKLRGEHTPVDQICYTPGTPFFAKLSFTYLF
ncbi:MAG: TonB-dependent receptor [Bacteroidetes bacterium]|nr:TonB-dependent receptor [Bacteroidota bacterium]MBS1539319.1 TonB-dependent receptor [Bacteroidota bacterium]